MNREGDGGGDKSDPIPELIVSSLVVKTEGLYTL